MPDEYIPSLEGLINRLFRTPGYKPLTRRELADRLGLAVKDRRALRATLQRMRSEGSAVVLRKNRWAAAGAGRTFTGRVVAHRRGTILIEPDEPALPRLSLAEADLRGAIHGDRVEAEADLRGGGGRRPREGAPGHVVRVIERRFTVIPGLFKRTRYYDYIIPTDARLPRSIRVRSLARGLDPGENALVAVALDPWTPRGGPPAGEAISVLGAPGSPRADVEALMLLYGLSDDFPEDARREAEACPAEPGPADLEGRRDLRGWDTVTIDPESARDFDDAVSLRALPGGRWELGVHIADVAHFVPAGGAVDLEARHRATSVYLADRSVPMLPRRLTAEVCSLLPDADRLCHSVVLTLDAAGAVEAEETARTVIRSRARLNYDQVQRLITGVTGHGIPDALGPMLRDLDRLTVRLRARRIADGAMAFTLPEVQFEFDDEGRVRAIRRRTAEEAYRLIEECMLLANRAVARRLSRARMPAIYRIHEEPDDEQWERMEEGLAELGFALRRRDRAGLNALIRASAEQGAGYAVALAILRNLKRAEYSPRCVPHFGLAFQPYTHFTSPIRRYPDLLVHRMLVALEDDRPPPLTHPQAVEWSDHCSRREREADEAERESVDLKRLGYLEQRLRAGDTGPFPAVVTRVLPKGWIVELHDNLQRAMIPRHAVRIHPSRLQVGAQLDVELTGVDHVRRLVDVRPWETAAPRRASGRSPSPRTARKSPRPRGRTRRGRT
jgi:ribonuclease R